MNHFFKKSAVRDLKKLPGEIQKRIILKLDFYTNSSDSLKFAEKLIDTRFGEWRFRIGDYRVIFDVERGRIIILKIGHRKDVYK